MLILKRRIGQGFLLDGRILVKLLSTARGSAIIGIQAPVAVPVLRQEIVDKSTLSRECGETKNKPKERLK